MRAIQMVDLTTQYEKIKSEVDRSIMDVLQSSTFIGGPVVKTFTEDLGKYTNSQHVIPCANGTDALQIAMMALDLQPGDEVITATFTYVATAEVIALLKLTPVLVDVDAHTFNIDIKAIEKAITPKTKAIVPVHIFGQCADMEPLLNLAKKHNLYVIEDVAQAIGAQYTFSDGTIAQAGTMGHIGTTSFFPSKNLGCYGDGGAILTQDNELANKMRMVANHGQSVKYYHDKIGVNSRLDAMQAAVLNVKLSHLDEYCSSRRNAAAFYDKELSGIPSLHIPVRAVNSTHVFHQYTLLTDGLNRDKMQELLLELGIPSMIYYPLPLHHQKAYQDPRYKTGDFPVSESLCRNVISLPMHTELSDEQLEYIVNCVRKVVTKC